MKLRKKGKTEDRTAPVGRPRPARRACAFVLLLSLASLPSSTAARAGEEGYDAVCAAALKQDNAPAKPGAVATPSMKAQYCKASASAREAANADSAMWKVWAAVSTVCTYACIGSFAGAPTHELVCAGASAAGGVTDGLVTKNYAAALMSIGGAAAGIGVNRLVNRGGDPKPGEPPKKEKDIGACINAATSAGQAVMKHASMNSHRDTARANLDSARKEPDTQGAAVAAGYQPPQLGGLNGTGGSAGNTGQYGSDLAEGTAQTPDTGACATKGDAGSTLQCALASDHDYPAFVSDPKFAKEFQKDTGKNLADFLNQDGEPASMMAASMSKGLSADQGAKLSTALAELSHQMGTPDTSGSVYAQGGGGSAGGGGGDDAAAIGQIMQNLMGQLGPKESNEKKTGVSAVIFANQTRSPSSVTEDRTLSIFDRITYRYYFVGRRIVLGLGKESR